MTVVPLDKLQANKIPSDIGFVKVGQRADINVGSFPATDFGVLEGYVDTIGSDALPPDSREQVIAFQQTLNSSQKLKLSNGEAYHYRLA